jgi:DNA polymerase-3 subunit alpha (Gram-positive type)
MDFYMAYFSIKPDVFDIETISGGAGKIVERLNDITTRMRDKILKTTVTTKEMSLVDIYKVALEMFARGFVIKNIDLDKSHAHKFIREGNNLIAPFNCVDGLGDTVAESIVKARGESPFTSREDLSKRTGINSKVMEKLIKMNIVSHLDESSQMSLNDFFE